MSTVFEMIIAGKIPGLFAWADEKVVAFATIEPIQPGHLLVVPREPIDQFSDLDDAVVSHCAVVAARIGRAQRAAFDAPRAALAVAGFEVPHAHFHMFPAWDEAGIALGNAKPAPREELLENIEKVRAALRDAGWGEFVPEDVTRL